MGIRNITGWIAIGGIALAAAACNDPSTGGNVANGDPTNQAWHAPDPREAGRLNPTGSDSGPWVGQRGMSDATTGVNDRQPERGTSAGSMATPPKAEWGTAANAQTSTDERSTPAQQVGTPGPNAETTGADRR